MSSGVMRARYAGSCVRCISDVSPESWQRIERREGKVVVIGCETCDEEVGARAKQSEAEKVPEVTVKLIVLKVLTRRENWAIAKAKFDGPKPEDSPDIKRDFSVKGTLGDARDGDKMTATGKWVNDEKWGWALKVTKPLELVQLDGDEGARTLLKRVKGVGPTTADKILAAIGGREGLDALIAANDASVLVVKAGLTTELANAIVKDLIDMGDMRVALAFVYGLGFGDTLAQRILEELGSAARDEIEADPYVLQDVRGIGYAKATKAAEALKLAFDDPRRLAACIRWLLQAQEEEGHTWTNKTSLIGDAYGNDSAVKNANKSGMPPPLLRLGLDRATQPYTRVRKGKAIEHEPFVTIEEACVQLTEMHRAELDIARFIERALRHIPTPLTLEASHWGDLKPSAEQVDAVELISKSQVSVLTGGPGRGKTAVTKAIIAMAKSAKMHVLCAAPTGKAASRMAELTSTPASTIHRLIGWGTQFPHNYSNPIDADMLIVDECSMVDTALMSKLVDALNPMRTRVVFVGDVDQLPSIGPGRVLFDLIQSGLVPTSRLTKIFRQASDSGIPWVADAVNTGQSPWDLGYMDKAHDVSWIDMEDPQAIASNIVDIVARNVASTIAITPMKGAGSPIGTIGLNNAIQERVNPLGTRSEREQVFIGEEYRARRFDRVIQTRNNYDTYVMNGETGMVEAASMDGVFVPPDAVRGSGAQYLLVNFGGRLIALGRNDLMDLQLAYAVTGHRFQGSQASHVVVPLHADHQWMLVRSWLYTAMTRAVDQLTMIGQRKMVIRAASTTRGMERRTSLRARLVGEWPPKAPVVEEPKLLPGVTLADLASQII